MVESKIDHLPPPNEMISTLDYIQKYPARTKQLLGISYEQFIDVNIGLRAFGWVYCSP